MSHHKYVPSMCYWESWLDQCKIRQNWKVLHIKQCKTPAQSMNICCYNCLYIELNQIKKIKKTKPSNHPSIPHHLWLQYRDSPVGRQQDQRALTLCQHLHESSCGLSTSLRMRGKDGTFFKSHPLTSIHPRHSTSALHYFSALQMLDCLHSITQQQHKLNP